MAKVIIHSGSTTEDMLGYIKPIVRKKLTFEQSILVPMTNGFNTMKEVKKFVLLYLRYR